LRTVSRFWRSWVISCFDDLSRGLERQVVALHPRGRLHQCLDEAADGLAVGRGAELLGHVGQARVMLGGGAHRRVDQCHHLIDLAADLGVDRSELVDEAGAGNEGRIDVVDVGIREGAGGRQPLVDLLIEMRIVAGRVVVPDLVHARGGGLAQRLDLTERDFGERHRAFVLVRPIGHRPISAGGSGTRASTLCDLHRCNPGRETTVGG